MIRPMIKTSLLLVALCLLPLAAADRQPPREFSLLIDGVAHRVLEGKPTTVTIGEHEHRVELSVQPYRTFSNGGLSFRYPEGMSYAFDGSGEPNTWDIDGNDAAVMLQEYSWLSEEDLREVFIDEMRLQFAGLEVRQSELSSQFGEQTFTGARLRVFMGDIESVQDVYFFTHADNAYVLVLVDTVYSEEGSTAEFDELFSVLTETFSLGT
jgi:hypothetical protein